MVLGKMPRSTSKLVKRIQGLTGPKKTIADGATLSKRFDGATLSKRFSFAQISESTQWTLLTGRGPCPKASKFGRLPQDIPHGCLAVYVGFERRRYVISTNFLAHSLFKELLKRSEEEFGFEYEGGLNIACDCIVFENVLMMIATKDPAAATMCLDEVMELLDRPF